MYTTFLDENQDVLDHVMAVFFPSPLSYTGEDVAEIHMHGSPVLHKQALWVLCRLGAVMARPGEFTERAFLHGKMNLVQAEAVCDIISAETLALAKAARNSMQGVFSKRVQRLQASLEWVRLHVEASIDFSDQDIDAGEVEQYLSRLSDTKDALMALIQDTKRALASQSGVRVVILGAPNSGKSTLLNAFAQDDVAIVTDIPGTTRDSLVAKIEHQGVMYSLVDTAGLREAEDRVEKIGIEKAIKHAQNADAVWVLVDATTMNHTVDEAFLQANDLKHLPALTVYNKKDAVSFSKSAPRPQGVWISAKEQQGLSELLAKTQKALGDHPCSTEATFFARERHLMALEKTLASIEQAAGQIAHADLFSEELRLAQQSLSELTGTYHHETLLDAIFSRFCLGK